MSKNIQRQSKKFKNLSSLKSLKMCPQRMTFLLKMFMFFMHMSKKFDQGVHIQYLVVVVTLFNSFILLVSIVRHPYQQWLKFYISEIIGKNNQLYVIRIAIYLRHHYFFIFHFRHFSSTPLLMAHIHFFFLQQTSRVRDTSIAVPQSIFKR